MENRFAAARRRYLRTHMDGIYTGMLLTVHSAEPSGSRCGDQRQPGGGSGSAVFGV